MNRVIRGAVFFDYDGTLTHAGEGVFNPTQGTLRAIAALRRNGYLALLDTGRAQCYASESGIDFDGMITSNGGYGVACGQVILDAPIPAEPLNALMARLNGMGIYYGIDHPVSCYARDIKEASFQRWLRTFSIKESIFRPILPGETPTGYKLSVLYHTMAQVEALRAEFGLVFSFDCHHGYPCVDVSPRTAGKHRGVEAVMKHFGIRRECTWAFGDGENDYDMLSAVGHGIAMGDHAPLLDGVSEHITLTVAQDGIARGLERYGLI